MLAEIRDENDIEHKAKSLIIGFINLPLEINTNSV